MCYVKKVDLNDGQLAKRVAQVIIDFINDFVEKSKDGHKCLRHELSPDYSIRLEESILGNSSSRVLTAKFQTLPGQALYQAVVEVRKGFNGKM